MTGIQPSKIFLAENGLIVLSDDKKQEIHTVLGGHIDWQATESKCNFSMPREKIYKNAYSKWLAKEKGLKIIYGDDNGITPPKLVPLDYKED